MLSDQRQGDSLPVKQESILTANPRQAGKDGSAATMSSSSHSSRPQENTANRQEASDFSIVPLAAVKQEEHSEQVHEDSEMIEEEASSCSAYSEADEQENDAEDEIDLPSSSRILPTQRLIRQGGCGGKDMDVLYKVLHEPQMTDLDDFVEPPVEAQVNTSQDTQYLKVPQQQISFKQEKQSLRKRPTRNQQKFQLRQEEMQPESTRTTTKRMHTRTDKARAFEQPLKIIRTGMATQASQEANEARQHGAGAGTGSVHLTDQQLGDTLAVKLRGFAATVIPMPYKAGKVKAALEPGAKKDAKPTSDQGGKTADGTTVAMSELSIKEPAEVPPKSSKLEQAMEIGQELDFFHHAKLQAPEKVFRYQNVKFDNYGIEADPTKVPGYYLKHVQPVYEDVQKTVEKCWSYHEPLYEISQEMIDLLETNQVGISQQDAEVLIDTWEKLAIEKSSQSSKDLIMLFKEKHCKNTEMLRRLSDSSMEKLWQHWKTAREVRKNRSFIRMFWVHQDDLEKPYKTFQRAKIDTKHYTRGKRNQDHRIKAYGSKFVERDNAVMFCQYLQSAHEKLLSQLDLYKLEDAQFDMIMGKDVQNPAMRELIQNNATQNKDEAFEQQLASTLRLRVPNTTEPEVNDFVGKIDRARLLQYKVRHARQSSNMKRYFHERLAHQPKKVEPVKPAKSIVQPADLPPPAPKQNEQPVVNGQEQVDDNKPDTRKRVQPNLNKNKSTGAIEKQPANGALDQVQPLDKKDPKRNGRMDKRKRDNAETAQINIPDKDEPKTKQQPPSGDNSHADDHQISHQRRQEPQYGTQPEIQPAPIEQRPKKKIRRHQRTDFAMIKLISMIIQRQQKELNVKLSGETIEKKVVGPKELKDPYFGCNPKYQGYGPGQALPDGSQVFTKKTKRRIEQDHGRQKMMLYYSSPRRQIEIQIPKESAPDMYELQYQQDNLPKTIKDFIKKYEKKANQDFESFIKMIMENNRYTLEEIYDPLHAMQRFKDNTAMQDQVKQDIKSLEKRKYNLDKADDQYERKLIQTSQDIINLQQRVELFQHRINEHEYRYKNLKEIKQVFLPLLQDSLQQDQIINQSELNKLEQYKHETIKQFIKEYQPLLDGLNNPKTQMTTQFKLNTEMKTASSRQIQNEKSLARQKCRESKLRLKQLAEYYKQLKNCGIKARRGRCNRVLYKPMMKTIFDLDSSDEENYDPGLYGLLGNGAGSKREMMDLCLQKKTDRQSGAFEPAASDFGRKRSHSKIQHQSSLPIDKYMATQKELLRGMQRLHQNKRERKHRYKMDMVCPLQQMKEEKKNTSETSPSEAQRSPRNVVDPVISTMFKKDHCSSWQNIMAIEADAALIRAGGMADRVYENAGTIQQKLDDYHDILRCQEVSVKRQKFEDSNNTSFGNNVYLMSEGNATTYPTASPDSPVVGRPSPPFIFTDNGPAGLPPADRQAMLTNIGFLKQAQGGRDERSMNVQNEDEENMLPVNVSKYQNHSLYEYSTMMRRDFALYKQQIEKQTQGRIISRPSPLSISQDQPPRNYQQ